MRRDTINTVSVLLHTLYSFLVEITPALQKKEQPNNNNGITHTRRMKEIESLKYGTFA